MYNNNTLLTVINFLNELSENSQGEFICDKMFNSGI